MNIVRPHIQFVFIFSANPQHWNDLEQALFDDCEDGKHTKNCLTFNTDALCTHYHSDHNYYALCRNMLSQYADDIETNRPDGLLHDMPDFAKVSYLFCYKTGFSPV